MDPSQPETNHSPKLDLPNHDSSPPPSPQNDKPQQDVPRFIQNATDKGLRFLSNASNETLGACLVGLGATTYFVLGRVGLILIGVVGGVALHATWESTGSSAHDGGSKAREAARRREVGADVAKRVLDWQATRSVARNEEDKQWSDQASGNIKRTDYSDFRPETASALTVLTEAIVRDYVKWWYAPIIPADIAFPNACRRVLTSFISSFSSNLARKRPADTFLEFTTNTSSIVIVFFNELSAALAASPQTSAHEAVQTYLRLKPQSNLSSIIDSKHQTRKLQMVADDILESYLDANIYKCVPARMFLREIFATAILETSIQKCARAEWINEWIVYLLEEGEPELMNVIDAGVESAGAQGLKTNIPATNESSLGCTESPGHSRNISKAEEAMDDAMKEAQRLTALMLEEDEKRQQEQRERDHTQQLPSTDFSDTSDSTNHGVQTPTSSTSDTVAESQRVNGLGVSNIESHPTPKPAEESKESPPRNSFTTFDQLAPSQVPVALKDEQPRDTQQPEILTLTKARLSIYDDGSTNDKRPFKSKPNIEFLIQVEPASSAFAGWMIARNYTDFETLHEVLRRISSVSGIRFHEVYSTLPGWKGRAKSQLREDLEKYLQEATQHEQLAESEGMKRFLEKSRGLSQSTNHKPGFWSNPANVGKGMVDVISKAPNQVAGGGKALFGGVSTVFSGGIARRGSPSVDNTHDARRSSADLGRSQTLPSAEPQTAQPEAVRRPTPSLNTQSKSRPSLEPLRSSSTASLPKSRNGVSPRNSIAVERTTHRQSRTPTGTPSGDQFGVKLPPPPEDMPDDYSSWKRPSLNQSYLREHTSHMSVDGTNFFDVPTPPTPRSPRPRSPPVPDRQRNSPPSKSPSISAPRSPYLTKDKKDNPPLNEQEAQVVIELLFAVIQELYTLSSAWNIRRTLLGAAKTFLLRPNNPQLESIRSLLQESVLEANGSDAGLAVHILKLRENVMPTEEELKTWPAERTPEEKEKLRLKARKLLCERGMPQALTSVMGTAASGEALGKVFDCLQIDYVARGVVFGLILQGMRAMAQ
ncbi:MAG: hypothetical protein M1831_006261 [Alyxoria varia]|nr:MAG: hypothetical protein M1831_006261 [Alyxoria varia]